MPTDVSMPSIMGGDDQKQKAENDKPVTNKQSAQTSKAKETSQETMKSKTSATSSDDASLLAIVPVKNKGGMFGRTVLPDVEGDLKSIANDKMIAVPVFKVTFGKQFDASKRQESGNWRSSGSSTVRAKVKVQGFREIVLQKITDAAYDDLILRLENKGLNVMNRGDMLSRSPSLQKEKNARAYPKVSEDESEYLAKGTMFPSGFLNVQQGRLMKAPSGVFSELKSGIIAVNYMLDFVAVKAEGKSRLGWTSESISATLSFGPVANVSGQIQSFGFKDGGCAPIGGCSGPQSSVDLKQVAYSTIPFGTLKDASTSGDTAINVVSGVLGILGGTSAVKSASYELTVDEGKFVKASIDALKKANERLIATL